MSDFLDELARLIERYRAGNKGATPKAPEQEPPPPAAPEPDEPFIEPGEYEDRRYRSRKVYCLASDASERTGEIPARPSASRRVFRYLQKYEVGTVKQISHSLNLDKKTIGNSLAALNQVGLVEALDLPKNE